MNILTFESAELAIAPLAENIVQQGILAIQERNAFNFVLTGGSSPKVLYNTLATKHKDALDWTRVFFFIGDERYVPANHPDYNGAMAKKALLDPLGIAAEQIFFVNTELPSEKAAEDYLVRISQHFKGAKIVFDYTLLGMGADAHTASIFPGTSICNSTEPAVESVFVEKLDSWRISMTAPLINASTNIAFLAFGKEKAEAFAKVKDNPNNSNFPASLIQGNVVWYVDHEIVGVNL